MQETISKLVTPYDTEQNPGYDNFNINRNNSLLDALARFYQQQNDNDNNNNNQGYISYPSSE